MSPRVIQKPAFYLHAQIMLPLKKAAECNGIKAAYRSCSMFLLHFSCCKKFTSKICSQGAPCILRRNFYAKNFMENTLVLKQHVFYASGAHTRESKVFPCWISFTFCSSALLPASRLCSLVKTKLSQRKHPRRNNSELHLKPVIASSTFSLSSPNLSTSEQAISFFMKGITKKSLT